MLQTIVSPKFHIKQTDMIFGIKVVQKKTDEHYQRTQHIFINLTAKFQLKQIMLIFCTKFTRNGYFYSIYKKNLH